MHVVLDARTSKHHICDSINETIYRACISANTPATKESVGLSRTGGKRPDADSVAGGKSVIWDASNVLALAIIPVGVTEHAANRNEEKYTDLVQTYIPTACV